MRSALLSPIFALVAFASPFPSPSSISQEVYWPNSYFALGDSYAAGPGAGKFFHPEDISNKQCKRFAGSYPAKLRDSSLFGHGNQIPWNFVACLGAKLENITQQRQLLHKQRAQLVTLSIGGNDFDFADVVLACPYNINILADRDKECDDALTRAEKKLRNDTIWTDYKAKVQDILDNHMTSEAAGTGASMLIVTGYPKFFDVPTPNDFCAKNGFPLWWIFNGVAIRPIVRERIRNGTDYLNQRIKDELFSLNDTRIRFFNPDPGYEGHRFCNRGANTVQTAFGEEDPKIWLNTVWEDLDEEKSIKLAVGLEGEEVGQSEWEKGWAEARAKTGNETVDVNDAILPTEMQMNSAFHPKEEALAWMARSLEGMVREYAAEHQLPVYG